MKSTTVHRRPHAAQAGAASLVVVMVLFFVMSLVAAYTSRNLIFEQRTSLNQYRSTQALEAAEAGVQWALGRLNGGRIGADCREASAVAGDTSFRQRYLSIDIDAASVDAGRITPRTRTGGDPLWPTCVWDGDEWQCDCPADAAPLVAAPAGTGVFPAFRVRLTLEGVSTPGVVRVEAQGCTRLAEACLDFSTSALDVEGRARVSVLAALKSALPVASDTPGAATAEAALTVLGDVAGGAALAVYNTAADRGGVTIRASGSLLDDTGVVLRGIPGAPPEATLAVADTALGALAAEPTTDRYFASILGAWPETYRLQPAAVRVTCPIAGCRAALSAAVAAHPDRVIYVPGDLVLETAGDVGSPPDPADPTVAGPTVIVVDGNVRFTAANVRLFGVVYAGDGGWIGSGEIHGAAAVGADLAATATPTIVVDGEVLDTLRLRAGSFVPLPGSWRDFE